MFDMSGGYVEAAVRVEGVTRPDIIPIESREVTPYVASEMKARFVLTVLM